ncbi:hypothetical protein QY95_01835 [Bacillus thermotolerans]|uniref:Uncharacterized protein n=1 Tax=Bacillus thermotolerans TaxID=1221996 RepID=A0A0F5I4Z2_BACTR|nr:hypothetical protein QY95_01835 [Bacillus thermotolerans]
MVRKQRNLSLLFAICLEMGEKAYTIIKLRINLKISYIIYYVFHYLEYLR